MDNSPKFATKPSKITHLGDALGHHLVRVLPSNILCEEGAPMTTTLLVPDTNDLEKLSHLPTELVLQRAAPLLARLVSDPAFLDACVLLLLEEAREADDWYVARWLRRPRWLLLAAGVRLASGKQNPDPRPHLLGCVLLRGGIGFRGALRTPG